MTASRKDEDKIDGKPEEDQKDANDTDKDDACHVGVGLSPSDEAGVSASKVGFGEC